MCTLVRVLSLLFFSILLSSCTQQFESISDGQNQEQLKDQVKLETKPDGSGSTLTSASIYLNQEVTFYPVKRDDNGEYVENISVSWAVEGGVGTLTIDPSGKNATFKGTTPGTAVVKIFIDDVLFSSTDVSVTASALELSNLQISNVTTTSFDVSVDYDGDVEENSSVSVFYCNESQSAGCDPLAGTEIALVRGSSSWTNSVTSLNVGETYNIAISAEDNEGVTGLPLSTQQQLTGTPITISNLVVSNITASSFDASIDFTGDTESTSNVTLYYCNRTNSSSCDPSSTGDSVVMTRSGTQYTVSVTGLTSPSYGAGDTIALEVVAIDPDGVTGSPLAATDYLGDIQLSNFNVSSESKSGFYAKVDFTERNSNATVMLYYCNETDSPGCDPLAGDSQSMTRSGGIFETTVSGLSSPYDEGDQVTAQAVASDPEGAYNPSGLTETFYLADITLYEMNIGMIEQDSFAISIDKEQTNGDDNGNGSATAYYCNNTSSPGCDPKTGVSVAISNFDSCSSRYCNYEHTFTNVSATASPGETINFLVEFIDPDGIWKEGSGGGSPATYSLSINIPDPTPVYRSVGPGQTSALIDGVGTSTTLTLTSSSASFSSALLDEVGVGDAIFYDSNNDSTIDALAFIHQRTDNQTYTLKDKDGNTPVDAVSHSNWKLYRAYTSAANAENGIENTGIGADTDLPAGLTNFDSWTDGKDISAQTGSDQHWYVALYAGTQADSEPLNISGDWVKDWSHDLEFFVPYKTEHVGVSQKHNGVWDNNKYRLEVTDATAINISYLRRVNIKGLQIDLKGSTNQVKGIDSKNNSQGFISSNIIKSSSTGTDLRGIQVYTYGGASSDSVDYYDYEYSWATFSNNIIYDFNTTDSKGYYVRFQGSNGDGQRVYNNTLYNNYFGVFIDSGYKATHIRNNIAMNSFDEDFEMTESDGNIYVKTNNISSDNTGNTTLVNATDVFLDPANDDFRLKAGATSAIDQGYDVSDLVTDDVQGDARSLPFDIGADEL